MGSSKKQRINFLTLFKLYLIILFPIITQSSEVERSDLLPLSDTCRRIQASSYYTTCDERSPFFQSTLLGAVTGPTQVKRQLEVDHFVKQLQNSYFSKIYPSLASHYNSIVWLTNNDYLEGDSKAIAKLSMQDSPCSDSTNSAKTKMSFITELQSSNKLKQLHINGLTSEEQNLLREASLKKYMLAALELNRILSSKNSQFSQDKETQQKIERLMDAYPLLSLNKNYLNELERKIVQAYHTPITPNARRTIAYNAEKILYPKVFDSDEQIEVSTTQAIKSVDLVPYACRKVNLNKTEENLNCTNKYDTQLLEKIINNSIPVKLINDIGSSMFVSWKNQLKDVNKFCNISKCNLMGINLDETARQINLLSKPMQDSALGYACKCAFESATVVLSDATKDVLSTALIGSSLLCPFTFGFGCLVASGSGAILTGTVALETASDFSKSVPAIEIAKTFPEVSSKANVASLQRFQTESQDRASLSIGSTVLSVVGGKAIGYLVLKGGKKVLVRFKNTENVQSPSK